MAALVPLTEELLLKYGGRLSNSDPTSVLNVKLILIDIDSNKSLVFALNEDRSIQQDVWHIVEGSISRHDESHKLLKFRSPCNYEYQLKDLYLALTGKPLIETK